LGGRPRFLGTDGVSNAAAGRFPFLEVDMTVLSSLLEICLGRLCPLFTSAEAFGSYADDVLSFLVDFVFFVLLIVDMMVLSLFLEIPLGRPRPLFTGAGASGSIAGDALRFLVDLVLGVSLIFAGGSL